MQKNPCRSFSTEGSFGENLKGIAARFFIWKAGDALLQFSEGGQSREETALDETASLRMPGLGHDVSLPTSGRLGKILPPLQGRDIFGRAFRGFYPRLFLLTFG